MMKRKHNITDEQAVEYWNALIDFCEGHTSCIGCPLVEQCKEIGVSCPEEVSPTYWKRAEVKKNDND